ncbi:hypothetical protein [Nocardioides insulae]|uniref:hypothetical protein n=1 Tax=Nocardioides insulae TaxID=394734 RepID=UPI0003F9981C|nr:hypothetical protein [Nocardioides insulae]
MAYLLLYGDGWNQRCQIPHGEEDRIRSEITRVGSDDTSQLTIIDPGSEVEATFVVAWSHVAAAMVVDAGHETEFDESAGQYA